MTSPGATPERTGSPATRPVIGYPVDQFVAGAAEFFRPTLESLARSHLGRTLPVSGHPAMVLGRLFPNLA